MADVKIPVSASVQGVTNELDKIPAKVEAVSRKLNKFKWQVIDLKAVEADLKKLEGMVADFQKRTGGLGLGAGVGAAGVPAAAPGPLYRPPAAPPGALGGGGRGRGGPGAYTHAPQWWDAGRNLVSGFGGGFGQIGGYGVRGGLAGYHSGGMPGAGLGMLKGLGVGALAYGAFKIGQGVNEGYEMAKERGGSLDTIKRQMGDLGISFARLKVMSDAAADGMQMNSLESAKLMQQFLRESRGADKTPEDLMRSVRTSVGMSKAYGLDPGVGTSFFGGMRNIDPKQNNRELALILGETIERSGMNARADEVMQVVQSFAATTSRMSLSAPNVSAHAGAYSSLMSSRLPGMSSDVAAGILNQANSSLMGMGGAGEAGQNFILAAMQRNGGLNPIQAKALAAGGLFGTRSSVFGSDSALGRYFGGDATKLAAGSGAGVTNFDAIRTHLAGMGGDKWLQLEGAQRLYGLSSPQQAAALLQMNTSEFGGLKKSLERAGVGVNDFNESGIQAMAKIGSADSLGLNKIFAGMRGRTGKGSLTSGEVSMLSSAQATGDTEKFRDALIKIASTKDREETQFSVMKDQQSTLEQIQINTGDKLIGPIQEIRGGINALVGKLAPDSDYMKQKNAALLAPQKGGASGSWGQEGGATGSWGGAGADDDLYAKLLKRESGGRHMVNGKMIESSAGALGISQVMPKTGTDPGFGVKPLQNQSQEEYTRFGRAYLSAMLKRYGGDKAKALAAYNAGPGAVDKAIASGGDNWLTLMPGETQAYVPAIMGSGSSSTPLPSGSSNAGGGRGFMNPSPVEVPLILLPQNQQGQSMGQAATARVSIPRGAGTAR